jgi:hypothetical protein
MIAALVKHLNIYMFILKHARGVDVYLSLQAVLICAVCMDVQQLIEQYLHSAISYHARSLTHIQLFHSKMEEGLLCRDLNMAI